MHTFDQYQLTFSVFQCNFLMTLVKFKGFKQFQTCGIAVCNSNILAPCKLKKELILLSFDKSSQTLMNLVSQALVSDGPDVMGRLSNRWVLSMTLKFPFST